MPIYLRQETKERPMHDQDPSDSPRLAAADLTEVAGMMRGLSALAANRGRPLPLNGTSYTSEDLEAIASRLQQIADHFNDVRKLMRTGQTKEQATPKAKPPSTKALIGALKGADREYADGLTPSEQGQAVWSCAPGAGRRPGRWWSAVTSPWTSLDGCVKQRKMAAPP